VSAAASSRASCCRTESRSTCGGASKTRGGVFPAPSKTARRPVSVGVHSGLLTGQGHCTCICFSGRDGSG
jgi:hypothetical protein